jgi:hypothetical protein
MAMIDRRLDSYQPIPGLRERVIGNVGSRVDAAEPMVRRSLMVVSALGLAIAVVVVMMHSLSFPRSLPSHIEGVIPSQAPWSGPGMAPRLSEALGWDEKDGYLLMFGGNKPNAGGGPPGLGDTWAWQAGQWKQLAPATSPPPGFGVMVEDPGNGHMLMVDSTLTATGNDVQSTWSWDGSTWTDLHLGTNPHISPAAQVANDTSGQPVVIDQAQSWIWINAAWQRVNLDSPMPGRSLFGLAPDPEISGVLLTGGVASTIGGFVNDTLKWQNGSWSQISTKVAPTGGPSDAAYDADRKQVVVFDEIDASTWTFSGGNWTQIHPSHSPATSRNDLNSRITYDPVDRKVVLIYNHLDGFGKISNETWVWDGADWTLG